MPLSTVSRHLNGARGRARRAADHAHDASARAHRVRPPLSRSPAATCSLSSMRRAARRRARKSSRAASWPSPRISRVLASCTCCRSYSVLEFPLRVSRRVMLLVDRIVDLVEEGHRHLAFASAPSPTRRCARRASARSASIDVRQRSLSRGARACRRRRAELAEPRMQQLQRRCTPGRIDGSIRRRCRRDRFESRCGRKPCRQHRQTRRSTPRASRARRIARVAVLSG